jgi:tRNA dimethylallyltransferase
LNTSSSTRPLVVVLVGPTASGKTALLDALFGGPEARDTYGLPEAEVVSADSMQAYRGMDIGTAKPDKALLSRIPHRLIDIREIREQYTAGDFVGLADSACEEIAAAGKLPVVSGGTGFYVKNFICGLPGGPAAEPKLRAEVARDLEEKGPEALRAELAVIDPGSAARIHERDLYRLTRALEIVRLTGRPMSDFAPPEVPRSRFRFAVFGLERPREVLARRIGERVEAMMAAGLAEEFAALVRSGAAADAPGMQAIGYREFFECAAARGGAAAIAEAIARDTRQYAKRQMTFFRKLPGIEWIGLDPSGGAAPARAAAETAVAPTTPTVPDVPVTAVAAADTAAAEAALADVFAARLRSLLD